MDNLIALLSDIENGSIASGKQKLNDFFSLLFDELVDKNTPDFRFNRQKDLLGYKICSLLKIELYHDVIIDEITMRLSYSRDQNDYDEIIIYTLVSSESLGALSILKEILKSNSAILKAYIFYHKVGYPIPKIFQTPECKSSIINFINSDYFPSIYEERCKRGGNHSELFAFPIQYSHCFHVKEFDHIKTQNLSASKLSKMASKERLESIRVIKDVFFKLELIKRYYSSYLPNLYKTRFIKLVNKTFPELELKKNGHAVYSHYL